MKIVITEIANFHDALLARGVGAQLREAGLAVEIAEAQTPSIAPAARGAGEASKTTNRKGKKKQAARAAKVKPNRSAQSRAAKAVGAGTEGQGTKRDAVRAALRGGAKTIEQIVAIVQKTFPALDRDYVGTVLCQLKGECELGEDRLWRAVA